MSRKLRTDTELRQEESNYTKRIDDPNPPGRNATEVEKLAYEKVIQRYTRDMVKA